MKARLARIAGLVLAGTLVVSTAAIDQKSKNTDADTSATVASGVTSALSGSLSDAAMAWPVFPEWTLQERHRTGSG